MNSEIFYDASEVPNPSGQEWFYVKNYRNNTKLKWVEVVPDYTEVNDLLKTLDIRYNDFRDAISEIGSTIVKKDLEEVQKYAEDPSKFVPTAR